MDGYGIRPKAERAFGSARHDLIQGEALSSLPGIVSTQPHILPKGNPLSKRNTHANKALRRIQRAITQRNAPTPSGRIVPKEKNKYAKFFR